MIEDERLFTRAIENAVRERVRQVSEEEIAAATKRVEERVHAELDKLALSLLNEYDVRMNERNVVITVKKEPGNAGKTRRHD